MPSPRILSVSGAEAILFATQCNTHHLLRMEKSVTTSVRLSRELKRRVGKKAAADGCGKNRVIIEALELYLRGDEQAAFESEARHQSQLASKLDKPDVAWDRMVEGDFFAP